MYDKEFDKLYGMGMVRPVSEDIEDFYELQDRSRYTEEMGLELEFDDGVALFF